MLPMTCRHEMVNGEFKLLWDGVLFFARELDRPRRR
jgi:hypothetical protein